VDEPGFNRPSPTLHLRPFRPRRLRRWWRHGRQQGTDLLTYLLQLRPIEQPTCRRRRFAEQQPDDGSPLVRANVAAVIGVDRVFSVLAPASSRDVSNTATARTSARSWYRGVGGFVRQSAVGRVLPECQIPRQPIADVVGRWGGSASLSDPGIVGRWRPRQIVWLQAHRDCPGCV
jgi:hypothetical protein